MSIGQRVDVVPESFHSVLSSKTVAVIGTLSSTGAPQVSPVWFIWDGDRLRFQVGINYVKYKNLLRDPRISVAIVDPENSGRYIEFRGTATISTEPDDAFITALARKYLDAETFPWETEPGTPNITVIPERIITMG